MTRRPTKAEVAAEDAAATERQRKLRLTADRMARLLARHSAVQKVALVGSVAGPLWREVSPYPPFRQSRTETVHRCNGVDLAVWVSSLDDLDTLRRGRAAVSRQVLEEITFGVAVQEIDLLVMEPGTDRYLGRVCLFKSCPADKRECQVAGCGAKPFLQQHEAFKLWPEALDPSRMVVLFDRATNIVASAAMLPSVVEETPQTTEVTVTIPAHRRQELEWLVRRWNEEG